MSSSKRKSAGDKSANDEKSKPSVFDRLGPEPESRDVCGEYMKRGTCRYGSTCKYAHPPIKSDDKSSDDRYKSSRARHGDAATDPQAGPSRRDSKEGKLKSTISVSKTTLPLADVDDIWPDSAAAEGRSTSTRHEEPKSHSRGHHSAQSTSRKDHRDELASSSGSLSKQTGKDVKTSSKKSEDDGGSGSKKKKRKSESAEESKVTSKHSQRREDAKMSKSKKASVSESAEKSKKKEGSKSVENRLIQLAQGIDGETIKDVAPRKTEAEPSSVSSRGNRHTKNETDRSYNDRVTLSPLTVDEPVTKDRRKTGTDAKEKSSGSKSQHKTKDSVSSEKDKNSQQRGQKTAGESGRRKPRTESTSSASSDSSSSSSSSSSGSSSSGSSSSDSSSSSTASSPKKQRQRTATKSKSDAQQTASGSSKTRRAKDATKSTDKLESSKPLSKDSNRRPREKYDDDGQKEHSVRGSTWKEDNEGGDRHRATVESRKESRHQRSGRDKKQVEVSPHRSRDEDLEQHGTPSSDRRLHQDSSVDYRQERMSARYSGEQRRGGRYDNDEHYDRLQHQADFEVSDRYRTDQHDEAHLQYADDRRRPSDVGSRRDRREYEFESRRGDYDQRDRDYELERGERYRREVDDYQHERLSRRSDWDVDDRHHSAQISSAGRSSYSDRRRAADIDGVSSRSPARQVSPSQSSAWEHDADHDRDRDGRGTRGHDVDRYTRSDADRAAGDERTSDKERDKQTERERPSDKDRPSERGRDRGSERGDKDRVGTDRDRKTDRSRDRGRTAQREGGSDRDRTSGTGEQEKDREQTSERYRDKDREDDLDHSGRRQESRDRGRDSKADGSEASKSSSWHSKRRRSATPDEGWDRRDRKRGRYDDDDRARDRGQHRDEGRYSPSHEHTGRPSRHDVDKHGLESVHTKSSAEAAPGLGKPEDRSRHVDSELSAIPVYVAEDRSRRSQSRSSLGGQRDPRAAEARYDSRHDFRLDPRHRDIDHPHDRPGSSIPPLHDREILPDRDVGYFRGGERGMGYDRVRIDHVDISRPPPPLPFRGMWPLEPDRLPARGSSDHLEDYHREVDRRDRGGGHHGLLRPPNWDRMDRNTRDEWETRYSHEQSDRRGVREEFREGLLPLPPPPAVRADGPRVKTEEPPTADKPADTPALPPGEEQVQKEGDSLAKAAEDIGYDDISEDELDDLIEAAEDEQDEKPTETIAAVVDILDIKWESLVSEEKPKPVIPGSTLRRFAAHHVLHDVGVSAAFAGDALIQKLKSVCQQQMDDEASKLAAAAELLEAGDAEQNKEVNVPAVKSEVKLEPASRTDLDEKEALDAVNKKERSTPATADKFDFVDSIAAFHATAVKKSQDRQTLVTNNGPHRRALCARRDLAVRRALCNVDKDKVEIYPAQAFDQDLYKLSIQLFRQDRERRPSTASAPPVVPLPTAAVH